MKIRKVKWNNHPVLGNLELNFTKPNGTTYNNIIFIGENGTGKTSIMDSLGTFLNMGSFDDFEYLEFETTSGIYRAVHREEDQSINTFFVLQDTASGNRRKINRDKYHHPDHITADPEDPRSYGCAISKARADYKTDKIKHTTTSELDKSKYSDDNDDNFTSLKQLFVDIVSQDEHDYTVINEGKDHNNTITVDDFRLYHSKQYRFIRAFDGFFADRGLKYGKVENIADNKEILFQKGANWVPIDNLSTGEKQIVYRGMYLLQNLNVLSGAVVFIDEPELSMHPRWQNKILSYYESLFKDNTGKETAQLFFATHSNFVVDSSFADPDNHMIILLSSDTNGLVSSYQVQDADRVLPRVSSAEINYLAFRLPSIEYHVELYGYLQIKEGCLATGHDYNVMETDTFIKNHSLYDPSRHQKQYIYRDRNGHSRTYETLCTYIRNCIDHPDPSIHPEPSEEEMRCSIELLRELCR